MKTIPKSPYNLLQEIYWPDSWKILVCCMFLNQTTRKQVDKIRDEFFETYPTALKASTADPEKMSFLLQPLGFKTRRTQNIIKMSRAFMDGNWKKPSDLPGIGKYAEDSYNIFMNHDLTVLPQDKILNKYMDWRLEYEKNKQI
jgi:endonuclease III